MSNRDRMEMEGSVIEACKDRFKVQVSDSCTVVCTISGKIRQNSVRILTGDRVKIEVSVYDTSKGRIVYRFSGKN